MLNFNIESAQCYYIAPFKVRDYKRFTSFLREKGWDMLTAPGGYDRHSINALNAEFLGLRSDGDEAFLRGVSYIRNDVSGDFKIFNRKKVRIQGRVVVTAEAVLENFLRIHIFPEADVGLLVFCFSVAGMDAETLIRLNYDLHKIDSHQSPSILFPVGKGEYAPINGFGTVGEMTRTLLGTENQVVELLNPHRLRAATCIEVAVSEYDKRSLEEALTHISMCFALTYKLPCGKDRFRPTYLFENIVASAFYEGLALAIINDNPSGKGCFATNFREKFCNSYLPIYLMVNLSECIIAANSIKTIGRGEKMLETLHKVKCFTKLPPSQYHHLVQLAEICSKAVYLPQRNEALVDYFEYKQLEDAAQAAHDDKIRDEEAKQRGENITLIALAFTIASVTFPFLSFLGYYDICELSVWGRVVVLVILSIIGLIIIYSIYKMIKRKSYCPKQNQ